MIHQEMIVRGRDSWAGQGRGHQRSQDELSRLHHPPTAQFTACGGQGNKGAESVSPLPCKDFRDLQDPVQMKPPGFLLLLNIELLRAMVLSADPRPATSAKLPASF